MPDEAKLDALEAADVRVVPTCGTCVHMVGSRPWGTCALITYDHVKHSRGGRQASVHASCTCPRHELSDSAKADLERSGFDRLMVEAD